MENTGRYCFENPLKNKKNYTTLKLLLTLDHMGLEISKSYSSYNFHSMSIKLQEDIGYHGGIQAVLFLQIVQVLKMLWHFKILRWESVVKYHKMCNILKTTARRAKRMKIWDSLS